MAINQEQILEAYKNIKPLSKSGAEADYLTRKAEYEAITSQPQGEAPATFQAQLENRLLNRDYLPSVARQERNIMKQFFTAPSSIKERLGGLVSPLQTEQLIGQQQANWMDELGALSDFRKGKTEEMKDIIASTALGYKAQYEKQKDEVATYKDNMQTAWDEYKEAVRQQERASDKAESAQSKARIKENIKRQQIEYMASRQAAEGESWDHNMGADKWMALRNEAYTLIGPEGLDWFEEEYPLWQNVKPTESNLKELDSVGIDYGASIARSDEKTKESLLDQQLSTAQDDEQFLRLLNPKALGISGEQGWIDIVPGLLEIDKVNIKPTAIQQKVINQVLRAYNQGLVTDPKALLIKIFGKAAVWIEQVI